MRALLSHSSVLSTVQPREISRGRTARPKSALSPLARPPWGVILLTLIVCLSASIDLVCSLQPENPALLHWLRPWMPFEVSEGRHLRMFLLSLLLFVLAFGLIRGKQMAWLCTIVTLALTPFLHWGRIDIWPQLVINSTLIGILLLYSRYFVARSDYQSVRAALILCPLLALGLIVIGTLGLHDIREQTNGPDSWGACLQTASELVLAHKTLTQEASTPDALDFFFILRVGGTTTALIGLFLTLRPVLERRRGRTEDHEKARRLVHRYGDDPFDPYALLEDKSYFFTEDGRAVIPYVLSGNFAVALANPIGHPDMQPIAIVDFALFCRRQDWEPVFYGITRDLLPYYQQAGFSAFKIGEGAKLRGDNFHLKGRDFQNLRTVCHKAQKQGIRFRWYDAASGLDENLERQLARISNRWLETKKTREMTFDMGSFSLADIRRDGAAVAFNPEGQAVAFATWRPFAQGKGMALDLMRSLPEARNVMDLILVESINRFHGRGIDEISLGIAPLANTEKTPSRLVAEEKLVQFLFENLNRVYGYKSLFEFKRKYRPQWRERYVAYRRGAHLPFVGLALVRVHAPDGLWKFLVR